MICLLIWYSNLKILPYEAGCRRKYHPHDIILGLDTSPVISLNVFILIYVLCLGYYMICFVSGYRVFTRGPVKASCPG